LWYIPHFLNITIYMAQIVKLRRSGVSGQKPTNTNLQLGEIALNTTDGKLFFAKSGSLGPTIEEVVTTNTINTGSINISGSINLNGNQTISGSLQISGSGFLNSHRILTDLDTGSMGLIDSIQFNTSSNISVKPGELAWNNTDGTLDLGMKGGNVVQQIGQEIFYEVRNETGIQIPNGTAVYANGVTAGSGRITAAPYTADGSIRENRFLGIATENITSGINGFVTHFGYVRGLDTRGTTASSIAVGNETWAVGDILYVHPTVAGKLTNVKPQHEITVAIIINRHQSAGVIFVRPSSAGHLEDIHDISINTGSLTNGQVLMYNNINGLWENNNNFTGSFIGDGSQLYNIPLSGVTNLTTISSSFDSRINTITGSITNIFSDIDSLQLYTGALNNFTSSVVLTSQTGSMTVLSSSFATTASVNASGASLIGGTGTSGQVAFWNGTNTQTGDSGLFWDNVNKRLGVGTITPAYKLDVNGISNFEGNLRLGVGMQLLFNNNNVGLYRDANTLRLGGFGGIEFLSSATNISAQPIRAKIFDTGNVAINTTTDAGFRLDVNGTARIVGQLTLGSTITNGTSTYTLPSATGTLALTSELHEPITLGTDQNGLSLSGQVLSLGLASGSANGALSSTDWTTFNNKQNALTNPITGTGTATRLAFFTGTSTISDTFASTEFFTISNPASVLTLSTPSSFRLSSAVNLQLNGQNAIALLVGGNIRFDVGTNFFRPRGDAAYDLGDRGNHRFRNGFFSNSIQINQTTDAGFRLDVNGTARIQSNLTVNANILLNKVLLSNQENLDVDSGATRVIATIASATYDAAFFDFVIKKGTNLRAGTVYAVHNGTVVEFTETSTNDIGNTNDVTLTVDLSSGNIRLLATTLTNDWIIKTLVRGI
jgi:hypothetical protein